jgi:hypothetical protein
LQHGMWCVFTHDQVAARYVVCIHPQPSCSTACGVYSPTTKLQHGMWCVFTH